MFEDEHERIEPRVSAAKHVHPNENNMPMDEEYNTERIVDHSTEDEMCKLRVGWHGFSEANYIWEPIKELLFQYVYEVPEQAIQKWTASKNEIGTNPNGINFLKFCRPGNVNKYGNLRFRALDR